MTECLTYALKTLMPLYDGLFVGCQGAFVTSFFEEIINNQEPIIKKIRNTNIEILNNIKI
jgi:hypothetical protein